MLKLRESCRQGLIFPLTELPERYLRDNLGMVYHCTASCAVLGLGKFSLKIQSNHHGDVRHFGWETDRRTRIYNDKLPMLIESIHVVDDQNRIIRNIGSCVVWLRLLNQSSGLNVFDSLYFSFISSKLLLIQGLGIKHREFDVVGVSRASSLEKYQTIWSSADRR
jgi:hypothetical protein